MMLLLNIVTLLIAADLPDGWTTVTGDAWYTTVDFHTMLIQRSDEGIAGAVNTETGGGDGAWRCFVEPSLSTTVCGIWFAASRDLTQGLRCELGGNPGVGGLALKDAKGKVLWQDEWAPWRGYNAYILEGIVEEGRARVQLLQYDGKTLLSQSDWVAVERAATPGFLGAYTESSIARFWAAERSDTPLSPITDAAPNKRRLTQGDQGDWFLLGTGNWMWTDETKTRIRQYAMTERAWAYSRSIRGANRVWQCRVRTYPGTGGAGMMFQVDEKGEGGFNCWLGGTHGAGCLMLYRNGGPDTPGKALWASPQDKWHYDEDLVLQAETQENKARVKLFAADGETVIAESPWIDITPEEAAREGYLGFHTWKGNAEFWAFSEETDSPGEAAVASSASALGPTWRELGGGKWEWVGDHQSALRATSADDAASCVTTDVSGARGLWRCRVRAEEGIESAGLLFQVDEKAQVGFACLLSPGVARLYDFDQQKTLWEDDACKWTTGEEYILEGYVATDRVRVRILAADGETIITESPAVYVPDTNNDREGHLGFTAQGATTAFSVFSDWSLE